ncbi:MAG: peptidylprolyl isomerase [candidate division Zixibacteria bacterium]|nr:peptidylprolyl isomerase [candidate division Zixibacteria bacterium]MCI0597074.1 peptidylprolyl isomerase [candidate division Zixibacteria bacterium]
MPARRWTALVFYFLAASFSAPRAQDTLLVDKVAAVVGREVITLSELNLQTQLYLTQSGQPPADSAGVVALQKKLLEQMVTDQLLLQQASRDSSLKVAPAEVNAAAEEQLNRVKSQFPTPAAFAAQLAREGLSERELLKRYRETVKGELLKQRLIASRLAKVTVADFEVKKFHSEHKDSLPQSPKQVRLFQILLPVEPAPATLDSLKAKAEAVLLEIKAGLDFGLAARRHSEDPSAERGGDIGSYGRGELVPEFERAAFGAKPGELAGPVKTVFGFHLIKVLENDGRKIHTQHILFGLHPSPADSARVSKLADSLLTRLRSGASFADLAKSFSADEESKKAGGDLGWFEIAQINPALQPAVDGMQVGEYKGPLSTPAGFHVLYLADLKEPHLLSLEADWDVIKEMARRKKTERLVADWVEELKKKTYVDIRY